MKGLLEKDRLLLFKQGSLIVVAVILLVYSFIIEDPTMISIQCCIITAVVVLTLVAIDNRDGFSFLMTMPVDAKTYVLEKNLLTWLTLGLFWLISRGLLLLSAWISSREPYGFIGLISSGYLAFLIVGTLVSLFIFLMLKFRTVNLLIVTSCIILFFSLLIIATLTSGTAVLSSLFDLIEKLQRVSPAVIASVSAALTVVLTAIFVLLGIRTMKKKEF